MFTPDHWAMLHAMSRRLTGYAFALTRDRDKAGDLIQNAIVRAMESRKVPNDDAAFRAWITRIVRNLWIDDHRTQLRQDAWMSRSHPDGADIPSDLPSEDLILNRMVIRQAFFALGADHRDVLALVDIAGFSYDEAAKLLDVNRGTIMSRVSRARERLLRQLSDEGVVPFRASAARRGRHD
ncbi:MAG TPA: RNA polymerase sigma factor [Rhizobium sp.]|nr:RNA polymerase sigma factor [Rhizobium sp.]